jgi:hypothetical protein
MRRADGRADGSLRAGPPYPPPTQPRTKRGHCLHCKATEMSVHARSFERMCTLPSGGQLQPQARPGYTAATGLADSAAERAYMRPQM